MPRQVKTRRKKPKRALNVRERKFLVAYLNGATGAAAAREAGYSVGTAKQIASELLTKPHIRESVTTELRKRQLSPEEVIAELEAIAKSSIKELWTERGIIMPHELPDAVARTIKKFKAHPTSGLEIELYGKIEALTLLGKLHKLFVDRHELTGKDGGAITIEAWRELVARDRGETNREPLPLKKSAKEELMPTPTTQ